MLTLNNEVLAGTWFTYFITNVCVTTHERMSVLQLTNKKADLSDDLSSKLLIKAPSVKHIK